ncbi:unnamed protein product [Clonostachys rosea]|uniref:Heterokaryon incompatibility domain-containing protein n=1 Tax=Bionectria ochroleuca TaxID=29856 RepID=A0ABY6UQ52_BIOOC|nr:unnamed protein product [Clonostachys rosea]
MASEQDSFSYKPVDSGNAEIRLLILHPSARHDADIVCDLQPVSLRDNPKFEALSYTWGDDSADKDVILNGGIFRIRENAAAALRSLRWKVRRRRVWIDAICINQDDPQEIDEQIVLMQHIYGQAEQVCIWLGELSPEGILGMRHLQGRAASTVLYQGRLEKQTGKLRPPLAMSSGALIDAVNFAEEQVMGEAREILDRPWWRRTWVIQEAVLARKLIVMCGSEVVTWESIQDLIEKRRLDTPKVEVCGVILGEMKNFPDDTFRFITEFRRKWHSKSSTINILEVLYRCRALRCAKPQDKVFGFLGIAPSVRAFGIKPDSKSSVVEVYRNFTHTVILGTKSLDVLNYARHSNMGPRESVAMKVYSQMEQARYHDLSALTRSNEDEEPRGFWARLPDGWERLPSVKKPLFRNHVDNHIREISPLSGTVSQRADKILERRELPDHWKKTWDNLGRPSVFYESDETIKERNSRETEEVIVGDLKTLPSWVPNWYTPPSNWDPEPLIDSSIGHQQYFASGEFIPRIHSDNKSARLCLDGLIFDHIEHVSEPWHPTSSTPPISRKGINVLMEWEKLATSEVEHCPYEHCGRKTATWRTMIADWAGDNAAPDTDEDYVEIWYDRAGWARDVPEVAGMSLWESSREEIILSYKEGDILDQYDELHPITGYRDAMKRVVKEHPKVAKKYGTYMKRIHKVCAHRNLFVTKKGYIGLAPWNAVVGDLVAVLKGGKTPFLLRPAIEDRSFELVGEIFVYGLMAGEALCSQGINDSPFQVMDIV